MLIETEAPVKGKQITRHLCCASPRDSAALAPDLGARGRKRDVQSEKL